MLYYRERERDRERDREEKLMKNARDSQREKEMEEEAHERKKTEKRAREIEIAYQERLRNWEIRERRKGKEYDREREKEQNKEDEREREAKRLKEFLEDYDDERDDQKYYKGRELQRRLQERLKEADQDAKDRNKEQEELEELKNKIFNGQFENPTQEFERVKKEREELYRPKILINVNNDGHHHESDKIRDRKLKEHNNTRIDLGSLNAEPIESDSSIDNAHYGSITTPDFGNDRITGNYKKNAEFDDEDSRLSSVNSQFSNSPSMANSGSEHPNSGTANVTSGSGSGLGTHGISLSFGTNNAKKKKLDMKVIFNSEDESEDTNGPKRRKLVPLGITLFSFSH